MLHANIRAALPVFSLILLYSCRTVDGFAAWLVDRKMGCWTNLEQGEVIMNAKVKAVEDSRYPDVHLQVFRDGEMMTPDPSTSAYPILSEGETVQLRLFTPSGLDNSDLQFVVETTKGAEFTAPYVGCEGKRSAGKKKNAQMTMKFTGEESEIQLIAGWATGHSAVTLTPKVIFKREDSPGKLNEKRVEYVEEGHAKVADESQHEQPSVNEYPQKIIGPTADSMPEDSESKLPPPRMQIIEALDKKRDMFIKENHRIPAVEHDGKERHVNAREKRAAKGSLRLIRKLQRLKNERNNDDFGSISFSMRHFVYAMCFSCAFLLLFILGVVRMGVDLGANGEQKDL